MSNLMNHIALSVNLFFSKINQSLQQDPECLKSSLSPQEFQVLKKMVSEKLSSTHSSDPPQGNKQELPVKLKL